MKRCGRDFSGACLRAFGRLAPLLYGCLGGYRLFLSVPTLPFLFLFLFFHRFKKFAFIRHRRFFPPIGLAFGFFRRFFSYFTFFFFLSFVPSCPSPLVCISLISSSGRGMPPLDAPGKDPVVVSSSFLSDDKFLESKKPGNGYL